MRKRPRVLGAARVFASQGTELIDGWRVAVQCILGVRNKSRYFYFINRTGAVAVQSIRSLSWVQELTRKNRDEFFNFIVRVSVA